jgi:hypothetical protein
METVNYWKGALLGLRFQELIYMPCLLGDQLEKPLFFHLLTHPKSLSSSLSIRISPKAQAITDLLGCGDVFLQEVRLLKGEESLIEQVGRDSRCPGATLVL